MAKVIVERPRRKDWKGDSNDRSDFRFSRNSGFDEEHDLDMDYVNSKVSLRKTHKLTGSYKELNENLSPLYNFIRKNVGRKWDDVYSEIRASINANSATQLHILEHVKQYVCTDPQAIYETLNEIYIWRFGAYNRDFYVDEAGNLRKFPTRKYVKPKLSDNVIFGAVQFKRNQKFLHNNPYWARRDEELNATLKNKKYPTHFCFNGQWFAIDWFYDVFGMLEEGWADRVKQNKMFEALNTELRIGRYNQIRSVLELFPKNAYLKFRNLTKKELKELKKKLDK